MQHAFGPAVFVCMVKLLLWHSWNLTNFAMVDNIRNVTLGVKLQLFQVQFSFGRMFDCRRNMVPSGTSASSTSECIASAVTKTHTAVGAG